MSNQTTDISGPQEHQQTTPGEDIEHHTVAEAMKQVQQVPTKGFTTPAVSPTPLLVALLQKNSLQWGAGIEAHKTTDKSAPARDLFYCHTCGNFVQGRNNYTEHMLNEHKKRVNLTIGFLRGNLNSVASPLQDGSSHIEPSPPSTATVGGGHILPGEVNASSVNVSQGLSQVKTLSLGQESTQADSNNGYRCKLCFKDIKNKKTYYHHMLYHGKAPIYACAVSGCKNKFKITRCAVLHMQRHFEGPNLSRQPLPLPPFSSTCQYCTSVCEDPTSLLDHVRKCHRGEDISHIIGFQGVFAKKRADWEKKLPSLAGLDSKGQALDYSLKSHITTHDTYRASTKGGQEKIENHLKGENRGYSYRFPEDGEKQDKLDLSPTEQASCQFEGTLNIELPSELTQGASVLEPTKLSISNNSAPTGLLFWCNKCDLFFPKKRNYTRHLDQFHFDDIQRYKCQFCKKTFTVEKSLDVHVQRLHAQLSCSSICHLCGMGFPDQAHLAAHLQLFHSIQH